MAMTVLAAAAHFLGYRYATRSADNCVPVVRDFLPAGLEQNGPRLVDCSTFMAALAAYVFAGTVDWDAEAYEDMQVMDASDLWSVVACWVRHGLGSRVPTGLNSQGRETVLEPPQGWAFFQATPRRMGTRSAGATSSPTTAGWAFASTPPPGEPWGPWWSAWPGRTWSATTPTASRVSSCVIPCEPRGLTWPTP